MDGLEEEYQGQLIVIRVNVQSPEGKQATRRYGHFTPTFVLFGPQGEEQWRLVGVLNPGKVRQSMSTLD